MRFRMRSRSAREPRSVRNPKWDLTSQKKVRDALLVLAAICRTSRMFGTKDQVEPGARRDRAASAWGGNPEKEAMYLNVTPTKNEAPPFTAHCQGRCPWTPSGPSVFLQCQGYTEPNKENAYSLNSITAKKGDDARLVSSSAAATSLRLQAPARRRQTR